MENGYKRQNRINSAIKKYGWSNIIHKVLYEGLTFEEASQKEKELIKKYNSTNRNYGYNNSTGGEKSAIGFKHTEEAKAKIKKNNARYWAGKKRDIETIEKLKKAPLGNTYRKGKKQSDKANELNRIKHSTPVYQMLGNKIINKFNSEKEAEQKLNLHRGSIAKVCKGKRKTTGGYGWKYADRKEEIKWTYQEQ